MKEMVANAMLEEYRALREEIGLYHQQQNQAIQFSLLGVVAAASFLTVQNSQEVARAVFLGVSLFVLLNGIAFADRSIRIKRIASYIDRYMRIKLIQVLDGRHVWHWEIFKEIHTKQARFTFRLRTFALDYLRPALFLVFSVGAQLLYCSRLSSSPTLLECGLFFLNVILLILFIWCFFQIEETSGSVPAEGLIRKIDETSNRRISDA